MAEKKVIHRGEKRYLPMLPVCVEGNEFDVLTRAEVEGYAERVKDVLWKVFNGNKEKEEEFLQYIDPEENGFFTLAELCYALGHVLLS